jgi:uncharacterized protein YerC
MVRMNKNTLPDAKVRQLDKQLTRILGEMEQARISGFLEELLGPEERLMLAKRLAVLVMLKEGYSNFRIADTLKLSPTTITNIKTRQGQGSSIEGNRIRTNHTEAYIAILEIVDSLLTVGGIMPRRNGLDRYKKFRE